MSRRHRNSVLTRVTILSRLLICCFPVNYLRGMNRHGKVRLIVTLYDVVSQYDLFNALYCFFTMASDLLSSWDPETCHIAAVVLARGGSKGIPLKNIKVCAGLPLIGWVLRAVRDSNVFDSVWVSTDHPEIAAISEQYGAKIHWRSPEVSKDETSSIDTVNEFLKCHPEVDVVGLVQCTSPAVQPQHFRDVVDLIRKERYQSVFSVTRKRIFRWKEIASGTSGRTEPMNLDPKRRPRRQDWRGELYENGALYFAHREICLAGYFQSGNLTYYEMSPEHSLDIDGEMDFRVAEIYLERYGYKGEESQSAS